MSLAVEAQLLKVPLPPVITSLPGLAGAHYGCDWISGNEYPSNNTGFVDINASYRSAEIPVSVPDGAYIRLHGRFPKVRFLAFATYDGFRPGNVIDHLADFELMPDGGGTLNSNPAPLPETNGYTAEYTMVIRYDNAPVPPAVREQNVIYAGKGSNLGALSKTIVMRLYGPNPGASRLGDVALPSLTYVGPDGGEIDLNNNSPDIKHCNVTKTVEKFNVVFPDAAITPPPGKLAFHPPNSSTTLLFYPNPDGRYLRAQVNKQFGTLVVMRQRAQAVPAVPPLVTPNPATRYWSVCMNSVTATKVIACHVDSATTVQPDGYFVTVISRAADRPALAYPQFGINWLDYGPEATGLLLLRQLLPDPAFIGNYALAEAQPNAPVSDTLGVWAPDISYCDSATFATYAGSGGDALLAACKASVASTGLLGGLLGGGN